MNRKTDNERKTEKLSIRLRKAQAEHLESYRKQRRLPSKGEAVRKLIEESVE